MSRKKSTIDDFFSERLKILIEDTLKVNQIYFSNKIGISQSYLSAILKRKRGASAEVIAGLYIHYSKYLNWLLTGEGKPIEMPYSNKKTADRPISDQHAILQNNKIKTLQKKYDDLKVRYS